MTKLEIYLDEISGYRNVFKDKDQIIWLWEQYSKRYKSKSQITRYWLNLLERHEKRFLEIQAFEMLMYLKSKVTKEQTENRYKRRLQMHATAQLELAHLENWHENHKLKYELTSIKYLN